MYPVSAVLANDEIMLTIKAGQHGSTYGGNPLACAIAKTSLDVLIEENMIENAENMGNILRKSLKDMNSPIVGDIRGKGLLSAMVIESNKEGTNAWDVCLALKDEGLLVKNTHGNVIRMAPPLVINEEEISHCIDIIGNVLKKFE